MNTLATSTHSVTDRGVALTRALIERFFGRRGQRDFAIRLWNGETLPAGTGEMCFTLVLNHPGALRRMFRPPIELSLGEAFIFGDFDIEGDIHSAVVWLDTLRQTPFSTGDLFALARQLLALPDSEGTRYQGRGPARLFGMRHSRTRDRAAITYHYDVGNAFYALWLDRRMTYSCAYFPTGTEDLDTAQECKLAHICRKLRLQSGERLLDIGCGWGGLVTYAAKKHDVRVLGITLSKKQADYANYQIARSGLGSQASVKLQDYRDGGIGTFDKIVSVGMFEHVGRRQLSEYFSQAYRFLKPDGLFLNHGISLRAPWLHAANTEPELCCSRRARPGTVSGWQKFFEQRILGKGTFIQRYIFPDGELIPVSEVNLVAEHAGFEVRDVENLREHYALTLRHWVRRLEAHREEAVQATNEVTYRTWRLYMAASAYGFESGDINVNQTLLAKPAGGRSPLPWTREDLYVCQETQWM